MNYRESEREKVIKIRDDFFNDPGGGKFQQKNYPFVLQNSEKNLWERMRNDAITYFKDNKIVWWPGSSEVSGHLLSSQVSCINHLFFLRHDKEAALKVLKGFNPDFKEVCRDFDDGYIGFEVVSKGSYLGEVPDDKPQTRGANCTSVDAMMTGILQSERKIQVLIEWKYTELYNKNCLAEGNPGATRKSRYNHLIKDVDSPLFCSGDLDNFYYEPFYQLMRQTLLAWKMIENNIKELNADDWLHFDVIPEKNLNLRYQITAPGFLQSDIESAWKTQLKDPQKYNVITPQKLLNALFCESKYCTLIQYLNTRYW